jgi:hypothetical protein
MKYFRTCCIILALISIVLSMTPIEIWKKDEIEKYEKKMREERCEEIRNEIKKIIQSFSKDDHSNNHKLEEEIKHLKYRLAACEKE